MDQSYTSIISETSSRPIATEFDNVNNYALPSTSYRRLFEEKKLEKGNKLKNGKTERILKTIQVKEKNNVINEKKQNPYLKLPYNHLQVKNDIFNTSNIQNESFYKDTTLTKSLFHSSLKLDKKGSNDDNLNSINVSRINNGDIDENNFEPVDDQILLDKIKSKVNNEELGLGPVKVTVVMKKKIVQTNPELTPLPRVRKSELKNKINQLNFHEAERTTVQIRRTEYSKSMSEKVVMLKKDFVFFNDPVRIRRIVQLQIWWKKIFRLNQAAKRIQSYYKGFMLRTRFNFIIEGMRFLNIQLSQFIRNIKNVYLKNVYNLLKISLKNKINQINKTIYIQAKIRSFLRHKNLKRNKVNFTNRVLSDTINRRLNYAFSKLIEYANLQFHLKLIQRFIKDKLKGFNIGFLKKSGKYKQACVKLRNGIKKPQFKIFITMMKKFIKLRKKENAQRIYRKKLIINKNHFYKLFAKFFNKWRGKILSKSPSAIMKETISKMNSLTKIFDILIKIYLKRININKLMRYMLKKYMNSVLNKFNNKIHSIKRKFELKRKKHFFIILEELCFNSRRRIEQFQFNMKKITKIMSTTFMRWKKFSITLKEQSKLAFSLGVNNIRRIIIKRSRIISEISSFKNIKSIQSKMKRLYSKLEIANNKAIISYFQKFKYVTSKAVNKQIREKFLHFFLKKFIKKNIEIILKKFFKKWEFIIKILNNKMNNSKITSNLLNAVSLIHPVLMSPIKKFFHISNKNKRNDLIKQKLNSYNRNIINKQLRNSLQKLLFNCLNKKLNDYKKYFKLKELKALILKKYFKKIKLYLWRWKMKDSLIVGKITSFTSLLLKIIKHKLLSLVIKMFKKKNFVLKLRRIILSKTNHYLINSRLKYLIIWINKSSFNSQYKFDCNTNTLKQIVTKTFSNIINNLKNDFLILHFLRQNSIKKISNLFRSYSKLIKKSRNLHNLITYVFLRNVNCQIRKVLNKWRVQNMNLKIFDAGVKITKFIKRKQISRKQNQINAFSRIYKVLKKLVLSNFKLSRYFKSWRNIIEFINEINNKSKLSYLKYFFEKLVKKEKDLLFIKFILWKKEIINRIIQYSSLMIQKYIKRRLSNLETSKIEAEKTIRLRLIKSAINNKIAIEIKLIINKSFEKWKNRTANIKQKCQLLLKYSYSLILKEKSLISIHFQKWRSIIFQVNNNEKASIIQRTFRIKKHRSNQLDYASKFLIKLKLCYARKHFHKLKTFCQKQAEKTIKDKILKSKLKKKNETIKRLISRRFIKLSRIDYFVKWAEIIRKINQICDTKLKSFFNLKGKNMKIFEKSFFVRWRNRSYLFEFINKSNIIKRNYFYYLFRKKFINHKFKKIIKYLTFRFHHQYLIKSLKLIKFVKLLKQKCYRLFLSISNERKNFSNGFNKLQSLSLKKIKLYFLYLNYSNNNSIPQLNEKIRGMFIGFFLLKLKEYANEYYRYDSLMYFLNVTLLHSNMNELKLQREIILRWRYQIIMKRISNSKLYSLYKNMQNLCDNIADDIFGENKGIIDEVYNEIDLINLKFQKTSSTKRYLSRSLPKVERLDWTFKKPQMENVSFNSLNQLTDSKKSFFEDECFSFSANSSFRQDQNID